MSADHGDVIVEERTWNFEAKLKSFRHLTITASGPNTSTKCLLQRQSTVVCFSASKNRKKHQHSQNSSWFSMNLLWQGGNSSGPNAKS